MDKKHYQLLILGSGPAGATAAIYAARANLSLAIITGLETGGQLVKTPMIANWPGEPDGIAGMALMKKMLNQASNFGTHLITDHIVKADLSKCPLYLQGTEAEYTCDALIIATGGSAKFLGLPSEQKYLGKGVSTCAICDGFFYKKRPVVIVGGGNTMAEEALYLAPIVSTATVIHRRDTLRAEEWLVNQLKKTPNIKLELNANLTEILGNEQGVTGVLVKNTNSNLIKEIPTEGVFLAIGHLPNTQIFTEQLELENNYIKTGYGSATATNLPGVFAAGDVVANNQHQAIVAAGSGCTAALDAKDFLLKNCHHLK